MSNTVEEIQNLNDCMTLVGETLDDATVMEIAEIEGLSGEALQTPEAARNGLKAKFLGEIEQIVDAPIGLISAPSELVRC